jgi:hypothetical protein
MSDRKVMSLVWSEGASGRSGDEHSGDTSLSVKDRSLCEEEVASGWRNTETPPLLRPGPMAASSRARCDPTHW